MTENAYILIVDDDDDMVEATRIVLESTGYRVDSAADAVEAAHKLDEAKPDLIILDVMMKSQDEGFQFSYSLKKNPALADIPILMVTSVGERTGFQFSPETDGDFLPVEKYLEKPVDPHVLLESVVELLKN